MTRKRHAFLAFCLLLAVSTADLWVTLHYNPSLSVEANPLVAQFGLEQVGLIVSNILIVVLLGFGLVLYQRGPRSVVSIPAADYWEYAGASLYNKRMTKSELWRAFLLCWPLPSNWQQFFRFSGFFTAWAIIAARISAVGAWVMIYRLKWSWYSDVREAVSIAGYPCLELLIGLVFGVVMVWVLFRSEYRIDHPQPPIQRS